MKRTYTLLPALIAIFFCATTARAQITAPFAVGVRGTPDGGGINLRYFFNPNFAIEGQGNYSGGTVDGSGKSTTFAALVEYHLLFGDERWRIFGGGGAHYGSWKRYADDKSKAEDLFGLDVILGLEYVFASIPVGISADAKPAFDFVSGTTVFPANTFGLGIRFYFGEWENYDSNVEDRRE